jgi:hypothetical protein
MKKQLFLVFFLLFSCVAYSAKRYVSSNGLATNSGSSESSAWSLDFAIGDSSPLAPGDSLILLDGVYGGNFVSKINGASGKPIYIVAENEGKAIIDVSINRTTGIGLKIDGAYTWVIGIHVTSSSLIRQSEASNGFASIPYESGIAVFGDNNKIINCWVYDVVGGGLELWRSGLNLEVYGSVIFNNGSQDLLRGTGHGMYIQHDRPDQPKIIENNFVFQNASQGINIYTTNPQNGGVISRRNVAFNTGVIATYNPLAFKPPHNFTIGSQNNVSYEMEVSSNIFYTDLQSGRLTADQVSNVSLGRTYAPNRDISFTDNLVFGGRNQVEFQPLSGLSFQRNKLFNIHGNFIFFLSESPTFPSANWDFNYFTNLTTNTQPFQGLSFQEWKTNFFPFDANSSIFPGPFNLAETLITQNKYDPFRFHVSILSFNDSEWFSLDFSAYKEFENQEFIIRDIQNPFDPTQTVKGIFDGNSILFPMNWTKSLQPKGNMPFEVKHTDQFFGTFLLQFEKSETGPVIFPEIKDSVAVFINESGKAFLEEKDFLKTIPTEPFTFSSSLGFEFSCADLGENPVKITAKNLRTGEEKEQEIKVWVVDLIPTYFDAADAVLVFDPVVGKALVSLADFSPVDVKDNCSAVSNFVLSRYEVTCSDIYQNSGNPTWEFPVELQSIDQSGNTFTLKRKIIIGNVIESAKVSISPSGPLYEGGKIQLVLGNELEYEVISWQKSQSTIPNETGKSLEVNEPGLYHAVLLLKSGCTVSSLFFEVIKLSLPYSPLKEKVDLNLDNLGKAVLKPENIFTTWPLSDPNLEIKLAQSEFTCTDLGEKELLVTIKNQAGQSWEEKTLVNVQDLIIPVLIPKTPSLSFDLTKGELLLNPEDFVSSLNDNCGIKSLQLNKTKITCSEIDLPIELILTATDPSGNSTSELITVLVSPFESQKISISPSGNYQAYQGTPVEIRLGEEFEFTVDSWLKDGLPILGEKGKAILVSQSGTYWARIIPAGGCAVETLKVTVTFSEKPFDEVKPNVELLLDASGKAILKPENVFVSWPPFAPNLDIVLSQAEFGCADLGEKEITITIKNQSGQTWEEKTLVKVQDKLAPSIVAKNYVADFDVTKGTLSLKPEDFITSMTDNCSVKEVTLNKQTANCDDLGKEIPVIIRVIDQSGNVAEATAVLTLNRIEKQKVMLSGSSKFCEGEEGLLTLSSENAFEVIRWRRNGIEIPNQTGKTLVVVESGKYHAVIRYEGGCLSESTEFEVTVNPVPSGKIEVEGNILRAPQGDFIYQWFRNGEKINGANSRTLTVDLMGEYSVELISLEGCKALLEPVTLAISGLGGRPVLQPIALKIYPNPASDRVLIELPEGKFTSYAQINLYSSEGRNVSEMIQITPMNSSKIEIQLNRIANGTYMIWIIDQRGKSYFGKIIVQN